MFDVLVQQCHLHQHSHHGQPAASTSVNQSVGSAPKSLQKTWCQLKSAAESMKPKKVRWSHSLACFHIGCHRL